MDKILKHLELYFDNYNISNLIKKIDTAYELYFDKKEKLFIILNTAKSNQICFKFKEISPSIINRLQSSRVENSKLIFNEIERHNSLLAKKREDECKQKLQDITNEFISCSNRLNHFSEKNKIQIKEGRYA